VSAPTVQPTFNIEHDLLGDFVRVVEQAAISAPALRTGRRQSLTKPLCRPCGRRLTPCKWRARSLSAARTRRSPMLYIGERVGATEHDGVQFPRVDTPSIPGTNPGTKR
jgi:fructose-1,6-bisphosphatase/sedoheptulose 1,7-bisphosphatase-like protein